MTPRVFHPRINQHAAPFVTHYEEEEMTEPEAQSRSDTYKPIPPGWGPQRIPPQAPTVEDIKRLGGEIVDLLVRKNQNYGNSVFKAPRFAPDMDPDAAIRVRLSDKLSRIESLLQGEPDKVGEALEDTLRDMVGYLILWLVWREFVLERDLPADAPIEVVIPPFPSHPAYAVPGPQSPLTRKQQQEKGRNEVG